MSNYTFSVTIPGPFEEAGRRVTEALSAEGFGVLSTVDVAQTLARKLGVTIPPYVILGACNPQEAHAALSADPDLGALLPCNVVLRGRSDGRVDVVFMDPEAVLALVAKPEIAAVAHRVRTKLHRIADTLAPT
ncbi:MAG: DUF302 domain-containing protein [Gammaproteobacteria bacterium]|nr:DUF302 domain-containing protein [Gammaproteobacteria bacterium]